MSFKIGGFSKKEDGTARANIFHELLPPFAVTFEPISLNQIAAKVVKPETGAVAVFGGVVRNVSHGKSVEHLEYEAYQEMALSKLRQVADEARQKWPKIVDIAIVQRIGKLEIGDTTTIVAIAAAHHRSG